MNTKPHSVLPEAIRDALPPAKPEEDALRRRVLDVLLTPDELPRMSYGEFLTWADEDTLAEWVDGEIIMMSPASRQHQRIGMFLAEVVGSFARMRGLGEVIQPPFQMKLEHGREPDPLFVAREHLDRLRETYLDGPADLVVEIISPESAGCDRGEKFYEYAQGGVPEYWLIDPTRKWAEIYELEGQYYRLAFGGEEGEYRSRVLPGFWLRAEWLWQEPLPNPLRVLGEVAGLSTGMVETFLQALAGSGRSD